MPKTIYDRHDEACEMQATGLLMTMTGMNSCWCERRADKLERDRTQAAIDAFHNKQTGR